MVFMLGSFVLFLFPPVLLLLELWELLDLLESFFLKKSSDSFDIILVFSSAFLTEESCSFDLFGL